jgi:hypothetical protein
MIEMANSFRITKVSRAFMGVYAYTSPGKERHRGGSGGVLCPYFCRNSMENTYPYF